ncbi:branched-chain amino acid ABC transporter permease [Geobacter sp. FeAm09]|uniref:branched-chain amino acid ABC transporter permease n=1 Tax=Geobacter sp. FeAm09 TaxID=2597769 RepID=UPI0011EF823C|nr:branched-chain amino acid ABC transporter permease [Geobacter sp. FeAm09]QEM68380.1 branched-chain amino acid ABC transporter permease [Geobacter sp. FeAm09]
MKPLFGNTRGIGALSAIAGLAVITLLFLFPRFVESTYALHIMILIFISIVMGSSWNLLGGYTGQYSVGHSAYFGMGAYTTMILMQFRQVPPWLGIWCGMAAALVVALVIGSICFRLRGPYFVLASIAVAEIFRVSALNLKNVTNGAEGILTTEVPPLKIGATLITDFSSKVPFYYTGLAFVLLVILVTWLIQNSKLGYYFQAIREDQDAAHSLGISLTFYKNVALSLSAVLTSLAGSLYAVYVGFIDPSTVLALDLSVQIVLICIIGGIGTIFGPVIGALVLVPLSEALRSNMIGGFLISSGIVKADSAFGSFLTENLSHAHVLIYGILVVVVILFMPDGVLGFAKAVAARKRKEVA